MIQRCWRARLAGIALLCLGLGAAVHADVVPPEVAHARMRLDRNPKAFDRVDSYCERLGPGAACTMPGTRFEGGGPGRCENRLAGSKIDLGCVPETAWRPELPDGPFRASSFQCRDVDPRTGKADIETRSGGRFVCRDVPTVHDSACGGRQPGDACQVEDTVRGRVESSPGLCTSQTEVVSVNGSPSRYDGASRVVVVCRPAKPVTHTWRDLNFLEKLLQ